MTANETPTRARFAWNPVILLALLAFTLALAAMDTDRRAFQARQDVHTRWEGQDLRLTAGSGSDVVVAHLRSESPLPDGSHIDVTAALPNPLALFDEAAGAVLNEAALDTLDWRDSDGRTAAPPNPGAPVEAHSVPTGGLPTSPGACSTTPGGDGANPLATVPG